MLHRVTIPLVSVSQRMETTWDLRMSQPVKGASNSQAVRLHAKDALRHNRSGIHHHLLSEHLQGYLFDIFLPVSLLLCCCQFVVEQIEELFTLSILRVDFPCSRLRTKHKPTPDFIAKSSCVSPLPPSITLSFPYKLYYFECKITISFAHYNIVCKLHAF